MKRLIRWSEVATYEVEIDTALSTTELEDNDTWFDLVDTQRPSWATDSLLEVTDRTLEKIE